MEIILPPTSNVEEAIEALLKPFDEDNGGKDYRSRYAFYDYYKIGGRWSGTKVEEMLGHENMKAFYEVLNANNITVSGVQFGKPTLRPASQIPLVDNLWNEHFPDAPVKVCPLFDNYKENYGDVLRLGLTPKELTCARLIIAGPSHDEQDPTLRVHHMLTTDAWNGVTFQNTDWNGTIEAGLESFAKSSGSWRTEYAERVRPKGDWLCVTIDYHS